MYIPVSLILFGILAIALMAAALIGRSRRRDLLEPPRQIEVSSGLEMDVRARLAEDDKIAAIKMVRDATGCGLREAKDFVEHLDSSRQ